MTRLLLGYYGDDFTGSTDVMEALGRAGLQTMLFLAPPTAAQLARFPDVRAVGIAGMSRALDPAAMERELRPAFSALRALGPSVLHYKICSTFDSSPTVGSIGRAIEIGQEICPSTFVPLVVGAPVLRRYSVFGHLFAHADGQTVRIDRHPTMRHHPVTPMTESDLRLHLAQQTNRKVALFDVLAQAGSDDAVDARFAALLATRPDVVLFDVLDDTHLATVGRLVTNALGETPLFAVGSSGLEYALVAHGRRTGLMPATPPAFAPPGEVPQTLVLSGSCSLVTEAQIGWALAHGYVGVDAEPARLVDAAEAPRARAGVVESCLGHLRAGRSVVVHSSRGPRDTRIEETRRRHPAANVALGEELGRILNDVLLRHPLRRVIVAGGDTSGHGVRALGIEALQLVGPAAPGSPLCRAVAPGRAADGLELVLKGGQVGATEFFDNVRAGRL